MHIGLTQQRLHAHLKVIFFFLPVVETHLPKEVKDGEVCVGS